MRVALSIILGDISSYSIGRNRSRTLVWTRLTAEVAKAARFTESTKALIEMHYGSPYIVGPLKVRQMLMSTIRLPKTQSEEIAALCQLGTDKVASLARNLSALGPTISLSKLRAAICETVGEQSVSPIERALIGLAMSRRRSKVSAADLLERIHRGFVATKWETLDEWNVCRPFIEKMLTSSAIIAAAKTADLSYDFDNVYLGCRVLTDARPIFDDEKTEIVGAAITQTLRLDYTNSANERNSFSVILDREDLEQLKQSCEDALRKAVIVHKKLNAGNIETIEPGEDEE